MYVTRPASHVHAEAQLGELGIFKFIGKAIKGAVKVGKKIFKGGKSVGKVQQQAAQVQAQQPFLPTQYARPPYYPGPQMYMTPSPNVPHLPPYGAAYANPQIVQQYARPRRERRERAKTPSWVMPAAIGGGALLLVVMMMAMQSGRR